MEQEEIFLTRASLPSYEEYIQEIKSLWDHNWITTFGPKHTQLEQELKRFLQCGQVSLFSNGHSALEAALQAMGRKGEIITTPYTFASTTNAIVRMGCVPVFCDIEADTCNIDPLQIEELITEKTCAILPVHVYGNVCQVERIEEIARRHGLKVIYDAAHAFGVEYQGKSIASFGDASVFSFHASKVYNTAEGGAVCYEDEDFGRRLTCIRNFGLENGDGLFPAGNGKMSELSAALGLCNLRRIRENIRKRGELSALYRQCLQEIPVLSLSKRQEHVVPNYAYLPLKFVNETVRNRVYEYLQKHHVLCQKHFERLTSSFSCYRDLPGGRRLPVAEDTARRILLLPLYADLRKEQVLYICDLIRESLADLMGETGWKGDCHDK